MRDLKVGDKVDMFDGSYAFGVNKEQYSTNCNARNGDRDGLTVVRTGLRVSGQAYESTSGASTRVCDVLVTNSEGGFWFTQSRFLKLCNEHTITIDDQEITISDKSYQELKRSLT